MDEQRQDDQLEPTYTCSVPIGVYSWRPTWSNGERWSGISMLVARHEVDDIVYLCCLIYHHDRVVLVTRISLTLSHHFPLSFIASGRSSGLHPVSSHGYWMYIRAGRPAFARSYVGVHKSTSLMSSSLLLQQCPACLVRLTWIVSVIGGRWPYSWCLVGCCRQDLFKISCSILV